MNKCCIVIQCDAVCCIMLQCVAVCCSVLQCVAVHSKKSETPTSSPLSHPPKPGYIYIYEYTYINMLLCDAWCSVMQCDAVWCSVMQCDAVWCSVMQCDAVCCSVLQCVAVCCSVLHCVVECCRALQVIRNTRFVAHSASLPNCVLQRVAVCCR